MFVRKRTQTGFISGEGGGGAFTRNNRQTEGLIFGGGALTGGALTWDFIITVLKRRHQ